MSNGRSDFFNSQRFKDWKEQKVNADVERMIGKQSYAKKPAQNLATVSLKLEAPQHRPNVSFPTHFPTQHTAKNYLVASAKGVGDGLKTLAQPIKGVATFLANTATLQDHARLKVFNTAMGKPDKDPLYDYANRVTQEQFATFKQTTKALTNSTARFLMDGAIIEHDSTLRMYHTLTNHEGGVVNPMYRHAVHQANQNMNARFDRVHQALERFSEKPGPEQVRTVTAFATTLCAPRLLYKGAQLASDAYKVVKPPLFRNLTTHDIIIGKEVEYLSVADVRATYGQQVFNWALTEEKLLIAPIVDKSRFPNYHPEIAKLKDVKAAGRLETFNGYVDRLTDQSGHYKTRGRHLNTTAPEAFVEAGFPEARGKYFSYFTEPSVSLLPSSYEAVGASALTVSDTSSSSRNHSAFFQSPKQTRIEAFSIKSGADLNSTSAPPRLCKW